MNQDLQENAPSKHLFITRLRAILDNLEHLPLWVMLLTGAVLYVPFTFLGYGSDSDSYNVVRIGQYFVQTFDYLPSRLPGYLVHEVFTYFLNLLGGSLLSNLGTTAMALLMLGAFRKFCAMLKVPHATLLTFTLMIHPFVWVSATSTIDYLWALGFMFLGFNFLLSRRYLAAAILLALAIGSRLSTGIWVAIFFIYLLPTEKSEWKRILITGIAAALISIMFYLPALDFLEWDFSRWLVLSAGDQALWTPFLRFGRFAYKNLMFWGIPAFIWLIITFVVFARRWRRQPLALSRALTWLSLGIILAVEVLFYRAPIEIEYLLPLLPFILILLAGAFPRQPEWLLVTLLLILFSNFLWINPAQSLTPNQTTGAIYGLWIEPGYLLQDVHNRLAMLTP